jgi:hypothetical protein
MGDSRSRAGMLLGALAAAGVFGGTALLTTITAPSAYADDYSDIVKDLNFDYSYAQTAYTAALSDFSSGQWVPGLEQLLSGVDDDTVAVPNTLAVDAADILQGFPVGVGFTEEFGFLIPSSYADAVDIVQNFATGDATDFSLAADEFSTGEFALGVSTELTAIDYSTIVPLDELLLGAAVSF